MDPVYEATLNVCRESFTMLRESVSDLSGEALDWKPGPNTNSIAILAVHSITATRFWIRAGVGDAVSLSAYREDERAAAFDTSGKSATELVNAINGCMAEIEVMLANGDENSLEVMCEWPEDSSMNKTGVQCLVHAIAHLREHVGQAQLTRDLWFAARG